nr:MAG TPA: hypothetical protein [Caudoviricetes sp.]
MALSDKPEFVQESETKGRLILAVSDRLGVGCTPPPPIAETHT